MPIGVSLELPDDLLMEAVRRLPVRQREALLRKLQRLVGPSLRSIPAQQMGSLTGLVSLGGDAVLDTEDLYRNG